MADKFFFELTTFILDESGKEESQLFFFLDSICNFLNCYIMLYVDQLSLWMVGNQMMSRTAFHM